MSEIYEEIGKIGIGLSFTIVTAIMGFLLIPIILVLFDYTTVFASDLWRYVILTLKDFTSNQWSIISYMSLATMTLGIGVGVWVYNEKM